MSPDVRAWIVIVVLGAGSLLLRCSFLVLAPRMQQLPADARDALRMIPAAALAALVAPALLRPDGVVEPVGPEALAGLIALVVAWRTRSVLLTIGAGMLAIVTLQHVLT